MHHFKRLHYDGSEALIAQIATGWRVLIDLGQLESRPITTILAVEPTVEQAREFGDKEISKHNHVCNESCDGWIEF